MVIKHITTYKIHISSKKHLIIIRKFIIVCFQLITPLRENKAANTFNFSNPINSTINNTTQI